MHSFHAGRLRVTSAVRQSEYTRSKSRRIGASSAAALFPREFLFVLGNKYSHLQRELLLMVGGAVVAALAGTLWALNASKAWIAGSWIYIPLTLATQVALIPITDFTSVSSVLAFNLLSLLPSLLLNIWLSYRGFRSLTA